MSSSNNETATKSDLATQQQQQQQQQESASENEESDSITDQSSSLSENNTRRKKSTYHHAHNQRTDSTHTKNANTTTTATQFSVQRSDVDGLRMKISAIRPSVNSINTQKRQQQHTQIQLQHKEKQKQQQQHSNIKNTTPSDPPLRSLEPIKKEKAKVATSSSNSTASNNRTHSKKSKAIMPCMGGSSKAMQKLTLASQLNSATTQQTTHISLPAPSAPCFSDATESGCSEATTTTIAAAVNEKYPKKIKVKRKKVATKSHSGHNFAGRLDNGGENKKKQQAHKKARLQNEFSSDSEDDLPLKLHVQRAPRLLLTAIAAPTSVLSITPAAAGSDNIGLSSSDNELPNLVKAAIKRVESDTEDTTVEGSFRKAAKTNNLPQYQSTLLQDFMEKTQMLGQNSASVTHLTVQVSPDRSSLKAVASSQSESVASGSSRKRRGRPKKSSSSSFTAGGGMTINESADSGVISTTSTTQSTTPSPKMPVTPPAIATTSATNATSTRRLHQHKVDSSVVAESSASLTAISKPKLDIAYLDKRMYATERVLYPPPRNKRRQSTLVSTEGTASASGVGGNQQKKVGKEELDPVWREIDVNKKFRLRTVSGYKSDGGTICSKILAAKSGYVSDYGSVHPRSHHAHNSGYKSDASCKSRYSTKSCVSRRSRAKSCGYRSDCKEGGSSNTHKSSKFRRKRRASMLLKANPKSVSNLNEQDILQLAGLSLGQSSEESNEYVCKPSLKSLPTTSASKKYGEINRYVTTGQYFGTGNVGENAIGNGSAAAASVFSSLNDTTHESFVSKMLMQRKSTLANDLAQTTQARKIKSRRSSAASYCSSYYSGTSRVRRRHRRKSLCISRSSSKAINIDSKLLTEIEIITSTFSARCRIQDDRLAASSGKEKLLAEANKLQLTLQSAATSSNTITSNSATSGGGGVGAIVSGTSGSKARDKRNLKKRKMSEPLVDFAMLSASAAAGGTHTPNTGTTTGKRRHKKSNTNTSPDDHKLPLKKRHYLLTPGEKSSEAAAFAATSKLNAEAWAAAAATAKSTASTKSQAQFNARTASTSTNSTSGKSGLTPKKRHLLQNMSEDSGSNSSPLRIVVDTNSISGGKLLDISPSSLCSLKQQKRSRMENALNKINCNGLLETHSGSKLKTTQVQSLSSPSSSCPPPGVFEPSVELEIQIPPIAKLSESSAIITKAEVASPLLTLDINASTVTKSEQVGNRVVEALLHKTGGNLLLKRKRKKINRTGFPTVRRKKRKNTDTTLPDSTLDETNENDNLAKPNTRSAAVACDKAAASDCERVPQPGEASELFVARANQRTPRLSVVALERLQGSPRPTTPAAGGNKTKQQQQQARRRYKSVAADGENAKQPAPKRAKPIRTEGAEEQATKVRGRKLKIQSETQPATKAAKDMQSIEETASEVLKTKKIGKRSKVSTSNAKKGAEKLTMPNITSSTGTKLETNIKLPAGIDPNRNFSCKIRLKRRNTLHPLTISKVSPLPTTENAKETPSTPEAIDAEAAAKDVDLVELEHDVLPLSEAQSLEAEYNSTSSETTSDEKSSNASSSVRKFMRTKKNYLFAGLFSDYFKQIEMPPPKSTKKYSDKSITSASASSIATEKQLSNMDGSELAACNTNFSLLPPPPYCESFFRRTTMDFELPYDIWWAFKHAKLPMRHTVPSWNYRKIRTNVYAESVRPNMAGFDHPVCNCKPDAGCGDNCLNRMVYTECSPTNCPAGDKCCNQKIQRHEVAPGVERFMTQDKGWGVRTKLPIKRGTYILEYVGEVVTEREFKDRMGTIYLNDTHHYCLHLDGGLVIDGQRMGSDCRFVNHSCEPNCEMQKWSVNGLSRMVLFAKRAITEGEELTYDYNFSLFNPSEGQPCRCNTPQCRGVIGGKSQRVKPLPADKSMETQSKEAQKGRQRKHKARKNTQRQQSSRDVAYARVQQLSEKEKKLVKQFNIFLVRNFEKIRRAKAKRAEQKAQSTRPGTPTHANGSGVGSTSPSGAISKRRPSTPASTLAAQISALCATRNIKTRGLTLAGQDPEVEKMAKMAVILRGICAGLESLKTPDDEETTLISLLLTAATAGTKKKKAMKSTQKQTPMELKTVQANIEQGHYKTPSQFDEDMQQLFTESKQLHSDDTVKLSGLESLISAYNVKKSEYYTQLLELIGEEQILQNFAHPNKTDESQETLNGQTNDKDASNELNQNMLTAEKDEGTPPLSTVFVDTTEDVIRCICGLYKDEGLMIQCSHCMVWQHTECTKADTNAENYQCERCEPRVVDREIPLEEFTEEGHRYYLSLMRGDLQVRQGDAVYVLRDIPIKDADGNVIPSKKHTYETIGAIDYQECDIFRVEHLWKNDNGKRFIFGHHFLRPHETFHEPTRRFYPNEVVRVSLYEVVPIELVIGRCWVLDRTTFCKGRPIECVDEDHCYICELRVDKTARFFSKAKANYPTCTKSYAFKKFHAKRKISKTYAPHDVDPAMLKTRKQKTETELATALTPIAAAAVTTSSSTRQEQSKTVQGARKPRTIPEHSGTLTLTTQALKQKRTRLENVLNTMKLKCLDAYTAQESPIDLTYLISGRGARQRKTHT